MCKAGPAEGRREEDKDCCYDPDAVKEPLEGRNEVAALSAIPRKEPCQTFCPQQKKNMTWD
jgi:hypothetical protein